MQSKQLNDFCLTIAWQRLATQMTKNFWKECRGREQLFAAGEIINYCSYYEKQYRELSKG